MAITVRQLIAKLKKMPPSAKVAWQNHDQSPWEIDGLVRDVDMADDSFYNHPDRQEHSTNSIVVLRP